jgi:para-nitrobenzyl esterase
VAQTVQTVWTAGGRVRGERRDDVWCFASVPYARAPVGPLRWRPPQPLDGWTGILDATEFGAIAPQAPGAGGLVLPGDPEHQSEDCLTLNVWTPGLDAGGRPVMVWIHGGGFTGGSGAARLYRGDELARRGDLVVVTVNYRLGAFGFLSHGALESTRSPAISGNWGLLDQVAALEWVRDHVAEFGGDPSNVTVFGESAGSMSIGALLAMPQARGLFHRAIMESGPPFAHSVDDARWIGGQVAAVLGLREATRAEWESVPMADLVAAVAALQSLPPAPGRLPLPFLPVVDGVCLARPPYETVLAGRGARVPLMIGTNRDELTLFALNDPQAAALDAALLETWVGQAVPDGSAAPAIAAYRAAREQRGEPVTPRDLWIAMGTDFVFRWPSLRLAAAHRLVEPATFAYLFTWETPAFDGQLGSAHALEIPFVFGHLRQRAVNAFSGGGPAAERLSDQMLGAWSAFARWGDPSLGGGGEWPAWDPVQRSTMVFGNPSELVDAPRDEELAVWEAWAPLAMPR